MTSDTTSAMAMMFPSFRIVMRVWASLRQLDPWPPLCLAADDFGHDQPCFIGAHDHLGESIRSYREPEVDPESCGRIGDGTFPRRVADVGDTKSHLQLGHLEDKEALVVGDGSGESPDDLHRHQGQGLAGGGIGGAALQADPACRCAIHTGWRRRDQTV